MSTDIEHISHNLFLLMLNLSQIRDPDRILSVFMEAIENLISGVTLRVIDQEEEKGLFFDISTRHNHYGRILVERTNDDIEPTTVSLLRNAIGMLAVILEKNYQDKLLAQEKQLLELSVKERTLELEKTNQQLNNEIQERKNIENQRDRLFNLSIELLCIAGFDGYFKQINPAFIRTLGWTEEELLSKPWLDFIHPDDVSKTASMGEQLIQGNTVRSFENRYRCKDGTYRWISWSSFPLLEDELIFAVARDITNQKQMEDELLKARKLESISLLAGGIAHDFNNLLMAIYGNLSFIKSEFNPESSESDIIHDIEISVERARKLTHQLLTFSKGGDPIKETASLAELVIETVKFALRGSNVRSEFSFSDDLYLVDIDKGQFCQVIHNLVINADQSMPDGGIISIRGNNLYLKKDEKTGIRSLSPGEYIQLEIQDRGIGIPEKYIDKIFDPYFTTKSKGNGLGLATSYAIISKHEGTIQVRSTIGEGTTFTIVLPASTHRQQASTQSKESETRTMSSLRILVMDDDSTIRTMIGRMLLKLGHQSDETKDGVELLELYRCAQQNNTPYDVIIMDLTIPGGMGGKETIAHIREFDKNVKVIVSSGYSNDPIMANFKQYGFNGIICKPYQSSQLQKVIDSLFSSDV
jgi:two-component system cell cycle sensor histidine kinase/response regulator CckA